MTPTIDQRVYQVRFKDGSVIEVAADVVCEPPADQSSNFYVFKKAGVEVAKYRSTEVSGWKVKE